MQKSQTADLFIGRSQQIIFFRDWLNDPHAPSILYLHDAAEEYDKKGGIGKTWLLRKYAEIVQQEQPDIQVVMIDFFNIADRDSVAIAKRIVDGLQILHPGWTPTAFTQALNEYQSEETAGSSEGTVIYRLLADDLMDDLQRLDTYLKQDDKTLLVFFDTFEAVEQNPAIAVLQPTQTFPDNYHCQYIRFVIAGRNKLDWAHPNWQGREQEVRDIALGPFSQEEMRLYIEREAVQEISEWNGLLEPLYKLTDGRPILIGLVTDVLNHHVLTLDQLITVSPRDFASYLVTRINMLEEPLNWVILFMAHVYHRFNLSILEWLLQEEKLHFPTNIPNPQELLKSLAGLSFVRRPSLGEDFALHDEMRRLVTVYCWEKQDPTLSNRKEISCGMIRYYEQVLGATQTERFQNKEHSSHVVDHQEQVLEQARKEQEQQTYIIEMLYHRLFVDLDDGLRYCHQQFLRANRLWNSAFAHLLIQEAQKFTPSMTRWQSNHLQFDEATLLRIEEKSAEALSLLEYLEKNADPGWLDEHRGNLLFNKGRCYLQLNNYAEALNNFSQAIEIERSRGTEEQQLAHILTNLGYVFRRRGQFDRALRHYQECVAIYKKVGNQREYANILNSISYIYRLQGKTDEALRWCKSALRIRQDLFREGKIGEVPVGLSLSTLGTIYLHSGDQMQAAKHFEEAYEIYTRANYRRGMPSIYNRFGQLYMALQEYDKARRWFKEAEELAVDFDNTQFINSLNKQGRLCILEQKWEEAIPLFRHAIEMAQQSHDYYQYTESVIDLAEVLEHLGQQDQAQQLWQEAITVSERENYPKLRGTAEKAQGELSYHSRDYATAFQHFAAYCHYTALYSSLDYGLAIRKVTDALFGIPVDDLPTALEALRSYWSKHQLGDRYPELLKACEDIQNLMEL